MTISKKNLSLLKVFALCLLLSNASCVNNTEKKVEKTRVIVKDTPIVKVLDTTAVPRPRAPGD